MENKETLGEFCIRNNIDPQKYVHASSISGFDCDLGTLHKIEPNTPEWTAQMNKYVISYYKSPAGSYRFNLSENIK